MEVDKLKPRSIKKKPNNVKYLKRTPYRIIRSSDFIELQNVRFIRYNITHGF